MIVTLMVLGGCSSEPDSSEHRPDAAAQPEQLASPSPASSSRLSLDWAGTYSGVVPCASCPGIETEISLSDDGSFRRSLLYIDESPIPVVDTGSFTWNDAGSIVTLSSDENEPQSFQVGEHLLFQLDMQGKRIEGDLADQYILHQHMHDRAIEDVR